MSFIFDPAGSTIREYSGARLIGESGAVARRYVHGAGTDEPLVWYEGSGTTTRRWFHADERGSVIAVSDGSGNLVGSINRYDDYGSPQGGAITGRFGYTGQAWIPEIGMYDYRARIYNPAHGGRFMQTDPIGYGDGMNLYAYVGNNPVNFSDPLGLCGKKGEPDCPDDDGQDVFVLGSPLHLGSGSSGNGYGATLHDFTLALDDSQEVVVFGERLRPRPTLLAAEPYYGTTFCGGGTWGIVNEHNPLGRINTGKTGTREDAISDLLLIADLNGISRLIYNNDSRLLAAANSPIPVDLGNGWYGFLNAFSGHVNIGNRGLIYRHNRVTGDVRLDIPGGFRVPGGVLSMNETCHYNPW